MIVSWELTIPTLSGEEPRRACVYVPESWDDAEEQRYPVLYMFDGQNVFFDSEATYGKSWGMADFAEEWELPMIVAAVESNRGANGERLSEYSNWWLIAALASSISLCAASRQTFLPS